MGAGARIVGDFLRDLGRAQIFLLAVLKAVPAALLQPRILIQQIYSIGVQSLIIIVVSGSFIGLVLALQGYNSLAAFGASESLGAFVALVMVRELGPVMTGLLFAGRSGSSMAAEIGLMRATDQLSGMEMMAVDPIARVVAPRFLAALISLPLLTAIFNMMALGVVGGHLMGVVIKGVDSGAYWSQIHSSLSGGDIFKSLLKSLIFAVTVAWIAVYQGYHSAPTSEGVSRATTSTVVVSSLLILGLNFILTAFLFR